ncbi:MAG: DUF3592 domain-containing protein, partial [Reyranellales bacterium]
SGTEARHHRFSGAATTVTTVPAVEYEFSAGGQTWRGNRIGIGDDAGGSNIEATLQRYPVGAAVSVYYDPRHPQSCLLERNDSDGIGKAVAIVLSFSVAVGGAVYWLATSAPGLLERYAPQARGNAPFVIVAASVGVVLLLFFVASYRHSRKAAGWPMVRGKILSSGSEQVVDRQERVTQIFYTPVVEYGYRVRDVDYVSRQIRVGAAISASQAYAAKVAARYSEGREVDVHYDPGNPSNAALENPTGFKWILLVLALAFLAVAGRAAGVI